MFSHISIGITDFPKALAFYSALLDVLALQLKFCDHDKPWAGWMSPLAARPLLVIGRPFNGEVATPGNGQMTALLASDRATVDRAYQVALASGGRCEGAPGLRPEYHPNYYGAYFRDPDGNKLCVCCHEPL
ncbi:VOC family protein [Undibacterium sp. 5I1]|uniref:VOC family protein n=1 Tax=unclassified Undibacterium TaxID=2630295 RepID=UPI002AB5AFDB|nr:MULTISPECIES: VOC family protein [unclassified Undibacterium]MDY7537740.1 VOC family protein [Undibacterium sp. 5I1]MEB0229856.1 VOC family protein [Undibacterium sp. 10I3]MEB0259699.1 VOC family protein [Undibacterium sp. 5I1]